MNRLKMSLEFFSSIDYNIFRFHSVIPIMWRRKRFRWKIVCLICLYVCVWTSERACVLAYGLHQKVYSLMFVDLMTRTVTLRRNKKNNNVILLYLQMLFNPARNRPSTWDYIWIAVIWIYLCACWKMVRPYIHDNETVKLLGAIPILCLVLSPLFHIDTHTHTKVDMLAQTFDGKTKTTIKTKTGKMLVSLSKQNKKKVSILWCECVWVGNVFPFDDLL